MDDTDLPQQDLLGQRLCKLGRGGEKEKVRKEEREGGEKEKKGEAVEVRKDRMVTHKSKSV